MVFTRKGAKFMVQTPDELQAENEQLRQRVAELEREQDEARDNRQWMEDLLEQSDIPICLWHGDKLTYSFANTAYRQRTGKSDLIGKPLREMFEEREVHGLIGLVEQAYASGERLVISEALVSLENPETGLFEDSWHNLIFNPVYNAQGEVIGVSNFVVEVTEQVRARQELYQQAQIFNQVRGSVLVTDMQGTIINWNQDSTRIYGYTEEEAIGQPMTIIHPPDVHEWAFNEIIAPLQAKGAHETEAIVWNKDGERFMVHISLSLLRDNNGTPIGMIAHSIDITERKRQEEEVNIFKTMADTAPDGFGMANADGTVTYANAAYRALTGYGDALIGMNFLDHFTEADRVVALEALTATAEQGDWQGVLNFQQQDGSIISVDTKGFVTRDEKGNIIAIMGLFRDLSEQYRQESERAALQQQIIDAQRAALRELSAPLLPISTGVVIMPLIGTVDSQRAQQIMETLLDGVATHRADIAIVDITGVQVVDTQVANALMQAAQAVRLLGAQVVLTGIGPSMAQTLVSLGVDLGSIITRGNLQRGIAYALRTSRGTGLKSKEQVVL
jgi:rsbT co-antagonist protein RsbR